MRFLQRVRLECGSTSIVIVIGSTRLDRSRRGIATMSAYFCGPRRDANVDGAELI
jgi:hypothetical protein